MRMNLALIGRGDTQSIAQYIKQRYVRADLLCKFAGHLLSENSAAYCTAEPPKVIHFPQIW